MSWTPATKSQFNNTRNSLAANYVNNINVIKSRWVPAALDYPNAKKEIENSKAVISNVIDSLSEESDKLLIFLKDLNNKMGSEMSDNILKKEHSLRKLEKENKKYEQTAETRKAQIDDINNKYEGNYHNQPFIYAPWDVTSSKWFSYATDNPYINLHPSSRSGLLFVAFFLGFASILVLGSKVAFSYYTGALPSIAGITGTSGSFGSFFNSAAPAVKPGLVRRF
jgi:hypothetical protein